MKASEKDYVTTAQLYALELAEQAWVWEGIIPEKAVTAIAAFPKVGKSTLVYGLLGAMFRGEAFLGRPTTKMPTLIVHPDEGVRRVRYKVEEYGFPEDAPCWYMRSTMKLTGEAAWTQVQRVLGETRATLLVIDSVSNFWDVVDENSNAEVSKWMARVMKLAEKGGVTVVLIYHHGKMAGGAAAGRAMRGASAFLQCLDQALDVFPYKDNQEDNERTIKILGRYDESPTEVCYALTEKGFKDIPLNDGLGREKLVQRTLQHDRWSSLADLSKQTELSPKSLRRLFTPLPPWAETKGKGVKGDPRLYRLLKEGA